MLGESVTKAVEQFVDARCRGKTERGLLWLATKLEEKKGLKVSENSIRRHLTRCRQDLLERYTNSVRGKRG